MDMKRFSILVFASFLGVAVMPAARASAAGAGERHWGSEKVPEAGVCFFQDKNMRGDYFCVPAGESLPTLPPGMNDKISSFRVIGGVDVLLFRDNKFKGPSGRYFADVRDLRREGWNDEVSSLHVTRAPSLWEGAQFPIWGRATQPIEGACFYKDADYRGDYFCVARGASYAKVPSGFNDQISSIRLIRAGGVMLAADHDFEGSIVRVTTDVKDLAHGVWNDKISSIRVF